MKNLSQLFELERLGRYREALDHIEAIRLLQDISPISARNLKLLEQRLRARLPMRQPKALEDAISPHLAHKEVRTPKSATWSAIITMWKRQDYLVEQLDAIRSQSIPPQEIIIILNEDHIPESRIRALGGPEIKIIRSDKNTLYSRWAIAYIAEGEYVSIFDDDVIPGKHWIANALRACSSYNALVGPAGRIYNKEGLHGYFKLVEPSKDDVNTVSCAETDIYCDWVCNSYLFKREWINHALSSARYRDSYKTFDDIQLATSLYLSGGIRCITPMQPSFDKELHGSLQSQYGSDAHAIWKTNSDKHFNERKAYIEELIEQGYVHVQQRDNLYRFHLIVPFGERDTLERCLLSVRGQTYQNFTCTLIDDCCDGNDALDMVRRVGLYELNSRYVKTTKKVFPLRAREMATDMLSANPADVIVHLDGDDWLPYPDVLSRLNRIYRMGGVLASYGNSISVKHGDKGDLDEFSHYEMSRKWNAAQIDPHAEVLPFRQIKKAETSSGWKNAPWCGMHLRTFQFAKWLGLNRKSFRTKTGEYHKVGTDAAIFIPILDSCAYESIVFVPELTYVYQNASNTIHAKKEISAQQKAETLNVIASADQAVDCWAISHFLNNGSSSVCPEDGVIIYDSLFRGEDRLANRYYTKTDKESHLNNCIITIVTPNFLADAIICLISYQCNLRDNSCKPYVFVATDNPNEISECSSLLADSGLTPIFPATLRHTREMSNALARKYKLHTDEYRWAMKAVVLLELLNDGAALALFLDPDTYTVSDITDVHQKLSHHPISVFPHFRDPDHEYLRGILYKDGFFNGGMLAATASGAPHLTRLYERCLHELVKEPSRHRWDDQKYFDLFALEVEKLCVNMDRGIDYNPWNYEPVEGLVAPSHSSILLKSGFFVRLWHVSTMLIKNSIEVSEPKFSVYRPIVAIYLLTDLYGILLLLAGARKRKHRVDSDSIGLQSRFNTLAKKLNQLSSALPLDELASLLNCVSGDAFQLDEFLSEWTQSLLKTICFDNYQLFASLLQALFPSEHCVDKCVCLLREHDLRYHSDNVFGSGELCSEDKVNTLSFANAGSLVMQRLQAFQKAKLNY